jgi:N-acetylmuramoyl-L-alanine amidase
MKVRLSLALTALITLGMGSLEFLSRAKASTFQEQAIDQTKMVAIARPYGGNKYDLLVLEQIPGKKQCWSESGANPVMIDPLLLQFDFTGICRRATDSNGYSIRLDGQDFGLDYILRVVERGGELVLVGTPRDSRKQELVVGRTRGMQQGFMKIILEPGWQFSRRAFEGKGLGHFYFSGKEAEILAAAGKTPPADTTPSLPSSGASFTDIGGDIYKAEIERAVALGFVAGFKEDNTFRPEAPVTREQFTSMVIGAIETVIKINLEAVPAGGTTFADVEATRWSAKRIQWARANGLVAGKEGGNFRPTDPVTRAEMMAVLRQVSIYLKTQQKLSPELPQTKTPVNFSDTSGHWAAGVIDQMSGFCGVASPLNEKGTTFVPNDPAYRNYAAAAIVRALDCVKGQKK